MNKSLLFFVLLLAAGGGVIAYLGYENILLKENKLALENEVAQTESDLSATSEKLGEDIKKLNSEISGLNGEIKDLSYLLDSAKDDLATTTAERDAYREKYRHEKRRMDDFSEQIGDIQGTVGTLKKLSETDPELLKKYSKVYFLNENYFPASFSKIDSRYTVNPKNDYLINSEIWPFLEDMLAQAADDKIELKIASAYRSFNAQSDLKSNYKMMYGSGANRFSADQGYSEHQLGTTVDFAVSENGFGFSGFDKTPAYQWLLDNAYEYGFIQSYPANNQYYQFEPWHWRFVGRNLAEFLHDDKKHFYDLDQREIDKYLISFYD